MTMPEPLSAESAIERARQHLANQRAAFLHDGPPTLEQRRADLDRLRQALLARRSEIEAALSADFGHRSAHETTMFELMTVVEGIRYLHKKLRRWMKPQRRHVAIHFKPAHAYVQYQPLGVVGIMSPWNYPLSLALMPLATALAAGNRALIKPSEFTPATSALLDALVTDLFPPEQVAVVQGDAAVGAAFSTLPFDHLLFTGSTNVGRAVMRAASEHLVPVTLELGGKSPVVIARGHAQAAAEAIAWGKLANAGQTCIAPDYVLLHESDIAPFTAAFDAAVKRLYPAGPNSPDYSSIINDRHAARLTSLLDDARSKGARIIETGHAPETAATRPHTLAPTLVQGATEDMRPPAPAGAVLLRPGRCRPRRTAGAHHVGQRHHQQHPDALRPGRPALRRRRPQRHGGLSRHRRLPRHEPCAWRAGAGPAQPRQLAEAAVRQDGRCGVEVHAALMGPNKASFRLSPE